MAEVQGKVTDIVIGIDLGKMNDYSAVACIERVQKYKSWPHEKEHLGEPYYRLMVLERFPLNTDWVKQAYFAQAIYEEIKARWSEKKITPDIIIDAAGVGAPMLDMFKRLIPAAMGCYFTSGHQVNKENGIYYVPKQQVVATTQIVSQARRIKFGQNIPDKEALKNEMLNFSYKINQETGYVSFEHGKDSQKDDQVLAIAIALWYGEKVCRRSDMAAAIALGKIIRSGYPGRTNIGDWKEPEPKQISWVD
jgi:hypothetical protein